jgi:uncharacterized protein (DUF2235 family)
MPKLRRLGLDLHAFTDSGSEDGGPQPVDRFDNAAQFARITSSRWPTIHFIGVWDTVASVIVPRPDRFYLPSLEELAYTLQNPSVKILRQAISIDEERCMFRLKKWDQPQPYLHNPFMKPDKAEDQDILQVWFAGVHSDVGGGYPEKDSGLSKYPLIWMIDEAHKAGLTVNPQTVKQLAWGIPRKGSPFSYVAPDVRATLHNSMTPPWRLLECVPKSASYKEWPPRKTFLGFYIPCCEPRPIPEDAVIHESVEMRMRAGLGYEPVNLPRRFTTFPMPTPPAADIAVADGDDAAGA